MIKRYVAPAEIRPADTASYNIAHGLKDLLWWANEQNGDAMDAAAEQLRDGLRAALEFLAASTRKEAGK